MIETFVIRWRNTAKGTLLLNLSVAHSQRGSLPFRWWDLGIPGPSVFLLGLVKAESGAGEQGGIQIYSFLNSQSLSGMSFPVVYNEQQLTASELYIMRMREEDQERVTSQPVCNPLLCMGKWGHIA